MRLFGNEICYPQALSSPEKRPALLPATQVSHPQPEQWSLMFPILLRVSLCCYESELKPNALSIGKAAIDLGSRTILRAMALTDREEILAVIS